MPTIQIPDSTYRQLAARAARLGITIETILERMASDETTQPTSTAEERVAELMSWVKTLPHRTITIDDSRDSIYELTRQ